MVTRQSGGQLRVIDMIEKQGLFDVCEYDPAQSAVFCKVKEAFGGCSNMSNAFPVTINGIAMRNTEALYQACRFPFNLEAQQRIIEQNSGFSSKLVSKPYRPETRPDWDQVRVEIMRYVLRVKLAQNFETFGALLESTGIRPIVELSRKNPFFWGAQVVEGTSLLRGQNVLGKLLVELRHEYVNACSESREAMRHVPPLDIPDFLLYGQPIQAVGDAPIP